MELDHTSILGTWQRDGLPQRWDQTAKLEIIVSIDTVSAHVEYVVNESGERSTQSGF